MFSIGDTVIHPHHGAGVVTEIKEISFFGNEARRYYSIKLLSEPGTVVMVPVRDADKVGLRPPMSTPELSRMWHRLRAEPESLPTDHTERYRVVREKLHDGDVLQVAEVVRDLSWKDQQVRKLTSEGKRLYDKGMRLLASEVAAIQGGDLDDAQARISETLDDNVKSLA
jgi:CarD family transcriptional regulator